MPRFSPHRKGGKKRGFTKLELFLPEWSRSYIVLALDKALQAPSLGGIAWSRLPFPVAKTHTKSQPMFMKLPRYISLVPMHPNIKVWIGQLRASISMIHFWEVGLFKRSVFSRANGIGFVSCFINWFKQKPIHFLAKSLKFFVWRFFWHIFSLVR